MADGQEPGAAAPAPGSDALAAQETMAGWWRTLWQYVHAQDGLAEAPDDLEVDKAGTALAAVALSKAGAQWDHIVEALSAADSYDLNITYDPATDDLGVSVSIDGGFLAVLSATEATS